MSTTVSTTGVIDTDGFTWEFGTYLITVHTSGSLPYAPRYTGSLDASGAFSVVLPAMSTITTSPDARWSFQITPNATSGAFTVLTTISGTTQDITALLNASAAGPRFAASPTTSAYGYGTVEVSPTPVAGSIFYDVTTTTQYVWSGSAWVAGGGGGSGVQSLTTTGTSGASTLVGTVLNVPVYAGAVSSLTTTGTGGASTLSSGVLNVPQYANSAQALATANTIYINNSTYNGSPDGGTTTTTVGVFAAGTTGTIASGSTFAAGQGIYIAGAGATISSTGTLNSSTTLTAVTNTSTIGAGCLVSGTNIPAGCTVVSVNGTTVYISAAATGSGSGVALTFKNPYIGTIVSINQGTGALVVTPATTTASASGALVQHDETAAIQAAVTALGALGGGTIVFPDGLYLVNGPLTDTSGANAVITMPHVLYTSGTTVGITFQGLTRPVIAGGSSLGAILKTSIPQGNWLGGYYNAGSYPGFTNVWLNLNNLTFRAYNNPGHTMINAKWICYLQLEYISCDIGATVAQPVNTAGVGIQFPTLSGGFTHHVSQAFSGGYYKGWIIGEHVQADHLTSAYCHDCFVFDGGNNSVFGSAGVANSTSVDYLWTQFCTNSISAGSYPAIINIQNADLESTSGNGLYDPSNKLVGKLSFYVPFSSGGTTNTNLNANGGAGVALLPLGAPTANPTLFSSLLGSTNTSAAMVVGNGASLAPTGTGTIQATNIASTIAAGTNVTITGSGTVASPYSITASSTASTAFSALTGSTNTSAAMVVGSGASLGVTGTGTNDATSVAGITITGTPSIGMVPTATSSSAATWQTGSAGSMILISDQVLGSPAATVTFSSISGSYKQLKLFIQTACSGAVGGDALYMQVNGDTGANYSRQFTLSNITTTSAGQTLSTTTGGGFPIKGASGFTSGSGTMEITIPNYAGTTFFKVAHCSVDSWSASTQGSFSTAQVGWYWANTAAITQLLFGVVGGSNLITGSRFTLYGIS